MLNMDAFVPAFCRARTGPERVAAVGHEDEVAPDGNGAQQGRPICGAALAAGARQKNNRLSRPIHQVITIRRRWLHNAREAFGAKQRVSVRGLVHPQIQSGLPVRLVREYGMNGCIAGSLLGLPESGVAP